MFYIDKVDLARQVKTNCQFIISKEYIIKFLKIISYNPFVQVAQTNLAYIQSIKEQNFEFGCLAFPSELKIRIILDRPVLK